MMESVNQPSDEEREMLRVSIRNILEDHWAPERAVEFAADPEARAEIWRKLANLGLATLGSDPSEGGAREIALTMMALGHAACPAPILGAALVNLTFRKQRSHLGALTEVLERLHLGNARVAFAFADQESGQSELPLRTDGATISGTLRHVEGGVETTHLAVAFETPPRIAVVDCGQQSVRLIETAALGAPGLCQIQLVDAPVEIVEVDRSSIDDANSLARLLLVARAYGAARRAFDLAVEYAKERKQFGKAIGSFQAIQHKLANCLIGLEGACLSIENACASFDVGDSRWRYFAAAAVAYSSPTLRRVSLETHHTFGAIGYAEEHEAPRHFKRVHVDTVALGGATRAAAEVASEVLDVRRGSVPKCDLGPQANAFGDTVREWLDSNWSGKRKSDFDAKTFEHREYDPDFAKDLGGTGWLGMAWPESDGGQARGPLDQLAFLEEMERVDAPRAGASIQADALILFGTAEQKRKYLPEILAGEAMHGMGYSEPDSGSDLASLRTRATWEDGEWVINGQKIWTTTWWGKYMFLAARTDQNAKPQHAGISMFIVPMDAPGITINPARTMYDGSFANIFYDNVRLPADALVGEVNGGWKVLTGALATERGLIGGGIVAKAARMYERLCEHVVNAARHGDLPLVARADVRHRLGLLAAEIEVGRRLMTHCANSIVDGATPPELAAISKVFSGELMERVGEAALDIVGMGAALSEGVVGSVADGRLEQGLRHSLMWVISIGTNEIQRTLIAQRGLGLPK
jgi:alkylation response protein AidB-like acyl-CoA dehydrogenase